MLCLESSPVFDNVWFIGNNAADGGAVYIYGQASDVVFRNCRFIDNTATFGGAAEFFWCAITVDHCLFDSNSSIYTNGSAMYVIDTELSVINSTFVRQFYSNSSVISTSWSNIVLTNTIFANNTTLMPIQMIGGQLTATYLDVFGNTGGDYVGDLFGLNGVDGNISEDPLFVNPLEGDFHLTASSPCIDAGDPNLPYDPDNTISDMGAFCFDQGPGPLSLTLDTVFDPWILPATGGAVEFSALIVNNTNHTIPFDAWTMLTLPTGDVYGPLVRVHPTLAPGGELYVPNASQIIPEWAPSGDYVLTGYLGEFPGFVVSFDEIHIVKAPFAGASDRTGTLDEWASLAGEWNVGSINVANAATDLPVEFGLGSAYPNPFNAMTTLTLHLPEAAEVEVGVYNTLGQLVATLVDGQLQAGSHDVVLDARNLASGVYFVHMNVPGQFSQMQKVVLMK